MLFVAFRALKSEVPGIHRFHRDFDGMSTFRYRLLGASPVTEEHVSQSLLVPTVSKESM